MTIRFQTLMLALLSATACSNAPAPGLAGDAPPLMVQADSASTEIGLWYWIGSVGAGDVVASADPSRYTIEIQDGASALIQADCNRGSADYAHGSKGSPLLGPIGLTKMGCAPGSQDQQFLTQLKEAQAVDVDTHWLRLQLGNSDGTALLARNPQASMQRYVCGKDGAFVMASSADSAWLWFDNQLQRLAQIKGTAGTQFGADAILFSQQGQLISLKLGTRMLSGCRQQN